jgi:tRNA (mo5U34)-methyltransferase
MRNLAEEVMSVPLWWHSIDLGEGVVTPGHKSPEMLNAEWQQLQIGDLSGMSVLDIGAWDGWFSFRAEQAGAERVIALDWRDGEARRGFDVARAALGSTVEYVVADFMSNDLGSLGEFDLVLFLGVLYHLREPIIGLERLARLTRRHALIETEAITVGGSPGASICEFYPFGELYGDTTNWWTPTETALVGMCNLAGFPEVNALVPVPDAQPGEIRHYRCVARANRG